MRSLIALQEFKGTLTANSVIITLPTNVLAEQTDLFIPPLPEKSVRVANAR